ncbi:class IIb bacteriocin, lactobin A/cerein 7B family [Spirosoma radiotolerans]|uniref:class IIb bacteriocin, lactobin A/cerein 7B family n=1 Tax=Spirosoma radiotolerans TaxID=1379870 RepID=UPI000A540658|nr:class IIb bacteriocin, lactobin A/cerein 7B family [Spirosoma radiotolerans]
MTNFNVDQAEVVELKDAELKQVDGGSVPWGEILKNIGEIVDTAGGFIDGLLGRTPQK